MKIVDYKCINCYNVEYDCMEGEDICPACKAKMKRLYGFRKYKEIPRGYYNNFGHEPVYIGDRSDFNRELKKRKLDVYTSEYKNMRI